MGKDKQQRDEENRQKGVDMVRIKVRETHIRTKSKVMSDGTKYSSREVSKQSVDICIASPPPEEKLEPCSIGQISNAAIRILQLFCRSICHWDWHRADAVIDLLLMLLGG